MICFVCCLETIQNETAQTNQKFLIIDFYVIQKLWYTADV
jgi:hypothetical protein